MFFDSLVPQFKFGFVEEGASTEIPSGEGQEPVTQEQPEVNQDQQGQQDQQDQQGERDPKNLQAENKRKAEKIRLLEQKLADIETKVSEKKPEPRDLMQVLDSNPDTKALLLQLREHGFADEMLKPLASLTALQARAIAMEMVKPINGRFAEQDLKLAVKKLGEDDNYKYVVEKFGDKVLDELKAEGISPEHWNNPKIITAMLGNLVIKNPGVLASKKETKERIGDIPMETGKSIGRPSGTITDSDVQTYAKAKGLTIMSDMDKQTIREMIETEKQLKKTYEEKIGG